MGAFIDLTGKKINRLTVISKGAKHGKQRIRTRNRTNKRKK